MELYNIKKFIASGMRRLGWTDEQFSEYQGRYKNFQQILGRYFSGLSNANLQELYQKNAIDWLIERGSIQISNSGRLQISQFRVVLLGDLYYHEVICPLYYDRSALDTTGGMMELCSKRSL